jgi:hypothetical protein
MATPSSIAMPRLADFNIVVPFIEVTGWVNDPVSRYRPDRWICRAITA